MLAPGSSAVNRLDDPTLLQARLQPENSNYTITAAGQFTADHVLIKLPRIKMQYIKEDLPRIFEGQISAERLGLSFLMERGPEVLSNGVPIRFGDIAIHHPDGPPLCHRSIAPSRIAAMSLPREEWSEICGTLLGYDPRSPIDIVRGEAGEAELRTLRRLHSATVQLAREGPEIISNSAAAKGLEAELIAALVNLTGALRGQPPSAASRQHDVIIRRFRSYLDENAGQPLYLPEVCAAVGTAERTLRLCCNEVFGVGPKRYLHLRRLNLAREKLLHPDNDTVDVTSIATEFGFWELGRFSVEYRRLFGESPSTTLRNAVSRL